MFLLSSTKRQKFLSTLSLRRATVRYRHISFRRFNFYPRSPCGERREVIAEITLAQSISIHALLAESDSRPWALKSRRCVFLSTLSLRRATIISPHSTPDKGNFYPRSPCGERRGGHISKTRCKHFYPRSPCGERLYAGNRTSFNSTDFYPRSPCGERQWLYCIRLFQLHFYPRSPCGERLFHSLHSILCT